MAAITGGAAASSSALKTVSHKDWLDFLIKHNFNKDIRIYNNGKSWSEGISNILYKYDLTRIPDNIIFIPNPSDVTEFYGIYKKEIGTNPILGLLKYDPSQLKLKFTKMMIGIKRSGEDLYPQPPTIVKSSEKIITLDELPATFAGITTMTGGGRRKTRRCRRPT